MFHWDVVPDNGLNADRGQVGFGDAGVDNSLVPDGIIRLLDDLGLPLGVPVAVRQEMTATKTGNTASIKRI